MIRWLSVLCWGLAPVAVSGCAPRREAAPPPVVAYVGGPLAAAEWGVGPIRAGTFFEAPAIQALFPRATVEDGEVRIAPDETRAVISVAQNGVQLLEIVDGFANVPGTDDPEIGRVRLVGGPVRGVHGETLGMSWSAAGFDLSQCEMGQQRDLNRVICARPNEGAVTYVFDAPGWTSEEFPPPSLLRAKGYLKTIIWTPSHRRRRG